MSRSISIIGTLDTKGDQIKYLKQLIEYRGRPVVVIDVGVLGDVPFEPQVQEAWLEQGESRHSVGVAGGSELQVDLVETAPFILFEPEVSELRRGQVPRAGGPPRDHLRGQGRLR